MTGSKAVLFRRITAILLSFAVVFSAVPILSGTLDVSAASKSKKAAKKITLRAYSDGEDSAVLSWNKIKKPSNGYAVFRDGTVIAHLGKKASAYYDDDVVSGKTYSYQVKIYKKKIKKTKMWYNKATGEFQKKKPAKNNRGKQKTVKITQYKYSKASNTIAVSLPASGGNSSGQFGGGNNGYSNNDNSTDPEKKYGPLGTNPVKGDGEYYITGRTMSCTDYRGVTRTSYELNCGYWTNFYWEGSDSRSSQCLTQKEYIEKKCNSPLYNRNIDGTFSGSEPTLGTVTYYQMNGVTVCLFDKQEKQPNDLEIGGYYMIVSDEGEPGARVYNGDPDKLILQVKNLSTINTYDYDKNPITQTYVMKDGQRLSRYGGIKTSSYTSEGRFTLDTKTVQLSSTFDNIWNIGFVKGDVEIDVSYDGHRIGTLKWAVNYNADSSGLSPARKGAVEIAEKAIAAYGGGDYYRDMNSICKYIRENYSYGERAPGVARMTCVGGAFVLDTYSVYKYGIYGFYGYGSQSPGCANYGSHKAFHPDVTPPGSYGEAPNIYFETEGRKS